MVTICGTLGAQSKRGEGKLALDGLALEGGETAVLVWSGLGVGLRWDLGAQTEGAEVSTKSTYTHDDWQPPRQELGAG